MVTASVEERPLGLPQSPKVHLAGSTNNIDTVVLYVFIIELEIAQHSVAIWCKGAWCIHITELHT
jgi:hypothetical protein